MAAWLAYLKSKLLIPQQSRQDDGPTGEEMAATLAFRLKRLEAMREAASRLVNRNRLGRDIFARGAPEHIAERGGATFEAELYDLLKAYANLRQRQAVTQVTIERRKVWSLVEARELLTTMMGEIGDWTVLQSYLLDFLSPSDRVTATASAFAASLELVREGKIEMRQEGAFGPLYLRQGRGADRIEPRARMTRWVRGMSGVPVEGDDLFLSEAAQQAPSARDLEAERIAEAWCLPLPNRLRKRFSWSAYRAASMSGRSCPGSRAFMRDAA